MALSRAPSVGMHCAIDDTQPVAPLLGIAWNLVYSIPAPTKEEERADGSCFSSIASWRRLAQDLGRSAKERD